MRTLLILVLLGLLSNRGFAQPAGVPGPTNSLSIGLWVPPADGNLQAPATIHITASISASVPAHAGDTIKVNFFADSKYLGTAKSVWHDGHSPDPHSNKPQPMIIIPAGYSMAQWVWKDAPAGTYSLTATVIEGNGLTAFSPPLKITVKP